MTAEAPTLSMEGSTAFRAILWGSLIAGTLDITAAFINSALRGRSPLWVLQYIASGLLGANSYQGGFVTAALGLGVHFLIATVACVLYYAASRKISLLTQHYIVCGLLYGVPVYAFMNLVVVRLAFPGRPAPPLSVVITQLLILMICIGLPISAIVHHYSK